MATNYTVNYDDTRFTQVEEDKNQAMTELDQTYDGIINESDQFYEAQINASKEWADKQTQLQQEQTDFAIEQIEQQKDQAQKDYTKEQSGAYVDWKKQSNAYGADAEQKAAAGLAGTGFSESSQVSMYNTYQNRVATARESFNRAILNYDNAIKDARLQNNSVLAEIAYQSLQTQLEYSLQGFQYKNQLILEQANKKIELDNMYYNRYQDVLEQINNENAMAENIRQFELQFNENIRQFNQNYELQIKQFNESIRQFDVEIARLKKKDEQEYKLQIQQLELEKQQAQEQKRQFEEEMKFEREKLEEQKRQFDAQQSRTTSSSSISKSSGSSSSQTSTQINKNNSNNNSNPTLDQSSVLALGLGPVSSDKLSELVSSGQVITETKNGKIYVKWSPNRKQASAQSALDKYTIYNPQKRNVGGGSF